MKPRLHSEWAAQIYREGFREGFQDGWRDVQREILEDLGHFLTPERRSRFEESVDQEQLDALVTEAVKRRS